VTWAVQMFLRDTGKTDSANIVKELSLASPQRGTKSERAGEVTIGSLQCLPEIKLSLCLYMQSLLQNSVILNDFKQKI
jgi:hypothetical protein